VLQTQDLLQDLTDGAARGCHSYRRPASDRRRSGQREDARDHAARGLSGCAGDSGQLNSRDYLHQQSGRRDEAADRQGCGPQSARFWTAGSALADDLHVSLPVPANPAALRAGDRLAGEFLDYDSADQTKILKEAIKSLDVSTTNFAPSVVHGTISKAKNQLVTADGFASARRAFMKRQLRAFS